MKLGRLRNKKLARSPQQIKKSAKALGKLLHSLLSAVEIHPYPFQSYWYTIRTLRQYIDDAEGKLSNDLFHLGVLVPEEFDWAPMEKSKRKGK